MKDLAKHLELFANLSILVLAILGIALAAGRFTAFLPVDTTRSFQSFPSVRRVTPGQRLPKAFATDHHHLIVALQRGCRFCDASLPFYARLLEAARSSGFPVSAVLPGSLESAADYLRLASLSFPDVKTMSLPDLGVLGTPTIILAAPGGAVKAVWEGRLSPEQEVEVLNAMKAVREVR
jgi:hypothetical protein